MALNRMERNRGLVVFYGILLWAVFLAVMLVKVQIVDYSHNILKVRSQSKRVFESHPKRGTIYDRHGHILAISVEAYSAFFSNRDPDQTAALFEKLQKVLAMNAASRKEIRNRIRKGDRFIWVKRKLIQDEHDKLMDLQSREKAEEILGFWKEHKRIYPQGETAAHILGGVGIDEQGLEGIEFALDREIKGQGGQMEALLDARKQVFRFEYIKKPVPGKDVYLTIDTAVQFFVERALVRTLKSLSAKGGSVLVMDSRNGDILAMASAPGYHPAKLSNEPRSHLKNRAVSMLYDPGSTFKLVTASAALEQNVCYPQQVFNCANGELKYRGQSITDHKPFSNLTFEEVLVHSSNIGAAKIALKLGRQRFYKAITDFGFGSKTGLPLPAEERGLLHPVARWSDVSTAFLAFGYEILVTPVQMTQAFNVLANGGYLMPPRLVTRVGERETARPRASRIISDLTRDRMVSILQGVVEKGTGQKAAIAGLDVAGKTGTAKKVVNGKYTKSYMSSFGGFFPAGDPRVTIYVVIDEPQEVYYGGDVAAPLFREIAENVMVYLKVFPQNTAGAEIRI